MSDKENKLDRIHLGLMSKQDFLANNSVPQCVKRLSHVRSVKDALKEEGISLATMNKEYSKDYALAYIEMWIVSLNDFISVKNKMSRDQIQETAIYIYDDYYYLKVPDLKLFFTNVKKGFYGEFYNHLDGTRIMAWLEKYVSDRMETSLSMDNRKDKDIYKRRNDRRTKI